MAQQLIGVDHIAADFFGALHLAAAGVEGGFLARFGGELVQFRHRMAQELFFGGDGLALGGGSGGCFARRTKGRPSLPHRCNRAVIPGVIVKDGAVAARVQQSAIVVLAVQFHQCFRQAPQHLARAAAVIDPSSLAPLGGVDAAQDQFIPGRQTRIFEHRMGRVAGRQIEPSGHFPLCCPLAYQIGATAPAQNKPK